MDLRTEGFLWDDANAAKCRKHGVSVAAIEFVLTSDPLVAPDLKHSQAEDRFIAVGRDPEGRPVFVAFTIREVAGRRLIRPIGARPMHDKERKRYEARTQVDER
jgi:hypothetical protein